MKKLLSTLLAFNTALIAGAFSGAAVAAEPQTSTAINHVTVYGAATEDGVIKDANVLIEGGKIKTISTEPLTADTVIDGSGKILSPAFIASVNELGLHEVSAVKKSRDEQGEKTSLDFDPALAFNHKSSLIPLARKGGISHSLIAGTSTTAFKGVAATVNLSGNKYSDVTSQAALVFELGGKAKGSRAQDLQLLKTKLSLAQASEKKGKKPAGKLSAGEKEVLANVLAGDFPLLAKADRSSDILQLLALQKAFGFKMVIDGGAGAHEVAEELKAAEVAVIVQPMRNLPEGFDALHQRLDNAAKLHAAGVRIILAEADTHNLHQLRFHAGNAVAHGLPYQAAIDALTRVPAEVFGLHARQVSEGAMANVVLWSGDPLELSSKVESLWINGELSSTRTRQDLLRERYTQPSDLPQAYTKPSL